MQQVNLGMIGGGTVGSGVFHALQMNGGLMAARFGVKIAFRKIAVKAFDEPRPYPIARALMTTDWQEVVNDPQIHVIIELVGGTGIAQDVVLAALETRQNGRHGEQGAALRARRGIVRGGGENTAQIFITRPASAAAFPSSNRCAKDLSATASTRFTASSTAPAITF